MRCSGKMYWEEYRERFERKNVILKIEGRGMDKNKLMVSIKEEGMREWLKEEWEKLEEDVGK